MKHANFIDRLYEILLTYQVGQLTNLNTALFLGFQHDKEEYQNVLNNPKTIYPKDHKMLQETLYSVKTYARNRELSYDEVCSIIAQLQMKQLTDSSIRLFHDTISVFDSYHRSLKLKEKLYHKRWYQMLDALCLTVSGTNPYLTIWKSWYSDEDVIRYGQIQIFKGQFRLEIIYHAPDVLELLTEGYKHLQSRFSDML